jgi:hypothetical protein
MKRQLQLQVPEPCHEDWNKMDPAQKGRFCDSCSKQVVDFTLMTDTEILTHLQKVKGNTCGRFSNDQLNRGLEQPPKRKSLTWRWLLTCVSSMLLFRSDAQSKQEGKQKPTTTLAPSEKKQEMVETMGVVISARYLPHTITGTVIDNSGQPISHAVVAVSGTDSKILTDQNGHFSIGIPGNRVSCTLKVSALGYTAKQMVIDLKNERMISTRIQLDAELMGKVAMVHVPTRKITIIGQVLDEKTNKPVPYATIFTGDHNYKKQTDDAGRFSFTVNAAGDSLKLVVEALGFENENGSIPLKTDEEVEVLVTMKPTINELPAVTVVSYGTKCRSEILGNLVLVKTDTVAVKQPATPPLSFVPAELPKTTPLNIYPNPALKGSTISIVMPGKDQWQVQLIGNNGVLIKTERATVTQKNTTSVLSLPSQLAVGMYYIQLINSKGQQVNTGKLLIQ